jgi:2',3'-cyclic-nucleotide 2'-phosphodiesterase (5'-nucleotidase family)
MVLPLLVTGCGGGAERAPDDAHSTAHAEARVEAQDGGRTDTQPEGRTPLPSGTKNQWDLTIFHTNDMHGAFLPEPATWRDDRALVGGMIPLAWHLAEQRRTASASLLFDAGDFMTGNPICEFAEEGIYGAGLLAMMNVVGYDAGVIGNHEFDRGRANARGLAARAEFPLLAADVLAETGEYEFAHEPIIFPRGELKIGVMGVSCASLFGVTAHGNTAGLSLRDQATAVRQMIDQLDPVTDLLVLITHNGNHEDRELARALAGSGLDVIVGGHSHTRLEEPMVESGIIIVQAGHHLKELGRLDLRIEDDRVVAHAGRLIELIAEGTSAGPELTALVETYTGKLDELFGQVIGTLAVDWERQEGESNIGNWLTDRLRERAGAEVAFLNSGTIRKGLPAGPIRLLDVHEILPFHNMILTFELTGEQLLSILTQNARAQVNDWYGVLQVSGLRYGFREVGDHVEVEGVTIDGKPLQRNRTYLAAAPDYVVMKAERYFGLPVPESTSVGVGFTDAICEAIKEAGTIRAETDGRILNLSGTSAD